MAKITKKQQVINHFLKHPLATPRVVSEKFGMATPAVYTLRKQAMKEYWERNVAEIQPVEKSESSAADTVQPVVMHWSDCAVNNGPAYPAGECNCGGYVPGQPRKEFTESPRAKDRQVGGDHYKAMGVQPWDVVDTWPREQRIGFYRGGALKYIMRMGSKDESSMEVAKGQHYIQKLLEVLNEQE